MNRNIIARNGNQNMSMVTTLPKGTVVRIPDTYRQQSPDGKLDLNATINHWLKSAESNDSSLLKNRNFHDYMKNKTAMDNFFKVQIVSVPEKLGFENARALVGKEKYIALGSLKHFVTGKDSKETVQFETVASTEAIAAPAQPAPIPATAPTPAEQSQATTTEANVCTGENCNSEHTGKISELNTHLKAIIDLTQREREQNIKNNPLQGPGKTIIANFEKTCGVKFSDYKKFLETQAKTRKIPAEIMLGILTIESAGNCNSVGDSTAKSSSMGLFQLSSGSSELHRDCTTNQNTLNKLNDIKKMEANSNKMNALISGPQCIGNLAFETIRAMDHFDEYLKANLKRMTDSGKNVAITDKPWKDKTLEEKNLFRITTADYNGGPEFSKQARKDMETFANKYKITDWDPYDWEKVRIFYFRRTLEKNSQLTGASSADRGTRTYKDSKGTLHKNVPWKRDTDMRERINVKYVDTILGRERENDGDNYRSLWENLQI